MNAIKEEVLKLPLEAKINLLHALQDNLRLESEAGDNHGLSAARWAEIKRREAMIESGEAKWITRDDINSFLKKRRNAI